MEVSEYLLLLLDHYLKILPYKFLADQYVASVLVTDQLNTKGNCFSLAKFLFTVGTVCHQMIKNDKKIII